SRVRVNKIRLASLTNGANPFATCRSYTWSTILKFFSTRIVFRAFVGLALLACVSCGGGKKYYPVHGSVLVNGKPAEGVTVVFSMIDDPDRDPARPSAGTKADGSFDLGTYLT